MNINQVLSFARTSEDIETPIIISRVGRILWATSAPRWYVPAERIRILERLGMDFSRPGRWLLYKSLLEFDIAIKPNFNKLVSTRYYPIELTLSEDVNPNLVYFNGGEYRTPKRYFDFVTMGVDNLSFNYNPKRRRMIISTTDRVLGVIIAGPEKPQFTVGKCIVCNQPGQWMVTSKGYSYSVCDDEHERMALSRIEADEFLSNIGG